MRLIDEFKRILAAGAATSMTFNEFLEVEIKRWKDSRQRKLMLDGKRYYDGDHDILHRKREVIVENGARMEDTNLPNNKLVDNQFAKMVDQKTNYLLSKPITYESEDETYQNALDRDVYAIERQIRKNKTRLEKKIIKKLRYQLNDENCRII